MANDIKLIGIDLDGTLLRNDQTISEESIHAIKMCLDYGIYVYLITGRPYCFSKDIAQRIDSRIKVIAANGGLYEIGNHIVERDIKDNDLQEIINILEDTNMKAFFKGRYEFYTHEPYDKRFLYDHCNPLYHEGLRVTSYTDLSWQELRNCAHSIVKVLVYDMDIEQLKKARDRVECLTGVEVCDYQKISFDINSFQTNKGTIIKEVLKSLHVSKGQFIAIGDSNNDIAMFEQAGYRVAMGNASEVVKKYCNVVTEDNEHDGVASILYKMLGKGE